MFFEHIFQHSTFLTVLALFTAFSTSQVFCDSLRFFKHISSYFEYYEDFLKSPRFFDAANRISRSIEDIDIIDDIDRMDGIDEIKR